MHKRKDLLNLALELELLGFNKGSSGNCSLRYEGGFMITPSGLSAKKTNENDLVLMDFMGNITPTDQKEPSSEWRFHCDILKSRPEINVVIHTHSTFATTLSLFRKDIPAFHYMIAIAGGNSIKCCEYELFGTQLLSNSIIKAIENRKACLLANHGLVVIGENIEVALNTTKEIESLCEQYLYSIQVGSPFILSDQQMDEVLEKFKSYKK